MPKPGIEGVRDEHNFFRHKKKFSETQRDARNCLLEESECIFKKEKIKKTDECFAQSVVD